MNNPQRQLGVGLLPPDAALKELNITVKEKTVHPGLFHILKEVSCTPLQLYYAPSGLTIIVEAHPPAGAGGYSY